VQKILHLYLLKIADIILRFIRNIRLKHSVQMLTNNMGNISEIAFAVGFNDPKYFSRCFKIEFGMTPKEYQESKKKQ